MNTKQLHQDLKKGQNLKPEKAVKNHRENPERIIHTIVEMCRENPRKAFSTKEIKNEYKKGLEKEVKDFMKTHDKWNPISWFAQQQTTGELPKESSETLKRWYKIMRRKKLDSYWHYALPESKLEKINYKE